MKLSHILWGIILVSIVFLLLVVPVSAQAPYNFTPYMTSNIAPSPNSSVASSFLGGGIDYGAWRAFNGLWDGAENADPISYYGWLSNSVTPAWVQINLTKQYIAINYTIYGFAAEGDWANRQPSAINFSGSNNGITWTELQSASGLTWASPSSTPPFGNLTFTVSNTNPYSYYRFWVVTSVGGGMTGVQEIRIFGTEAPPVASFTTNVTTGTAPTAVLLTDTSTNTPTSRAWGAKNLTPGNNTWFSLGTTTPLTTVLGIGNWSLNLTATNAAGSNISTQVTWLNVSSGVAPPVVSFTTNVTEGVNDLALYLNDTSTGSPTMWNTSWGDNEWTNQTSFPATNITHVYSTAGTYWINEYATNAYGTANGTPLLITVYGAAHSNFTAWNTAGNAPHTTYLYDTSTNLTPGADTYYWMFGDGNTSTSQYLYYTWNITGTYSVNHSFSNGLSTSWMNKSAYVTVGSPEVTPVASFYGGPQLGAPPMLVYFTDVSTHTPTSWNWSFGDGLYGITQNPSHWYNSSGFFTVNLTATNGAGSNTLSQSNFVMVY